MKIDYPYPPQHYRDGAADVQAAQVDQLVAAGAKLHLFGQEEPLKRPEPSIAPNFLINCEQSLFLQLPPRQELLNLHRLFCTALSEYLSAAAGETEKLGEAVKKLRNVVGHVFHLFAYARSTLQARLDLGDLYRAEIVAAEAINADLRTFIAELAAEL